MGRQSRDLGALDFVGKPALVLEHCITNLLVSEGKEMFVGGCLE